MEATSQCYITKWNTLEDIAIVENDLRQHLADLRVVRHTQVGHRFRGLDGDLKSAIDRSIDWPSIGEESRDDSSSQLYYSNIISG